MKPFNARFIRAVLKPDEPVPPSLTIPHDKIERRFSVYRNNVVASLIEGLEVSFPVIKKLVGDEFFSAMAGLYVRKFPPSSPLMMFYGKDMPDFLRSFPPVQHLPYLPDIAILENKIRESYHSSDPEPLGFVVLENLPIEEQLRIKLILSPALSVLSSDFPIVSIWEANIKDGPNPRAGEEYALIVRPEFDPYPTKVSMGEFHFIKHLMNGDTISKACEKTLFHSEELQFDFAELFRLLLTTNSISKVVS